MTTAAPPASPALPQVLLAHHLRQLKLQLDKILVEQLSEDPILKEDFVTLRDESTNTVPTTGSRKTTWNPGEARRSELKS